MKKLEDSLSVVVPSGLTLGVVNLTTLNAAASLVLTLLTIVYLLWRWNRQAKQTKPPAEDDIAS
jgi:hypothetical protein